MLITERRLNERLSDEIRKSYGFTFDTNEKAKQILNESRASKFYKDSTDVYDIFLSHSISDSAKIAGLKLIMEDMGYKVYVDWIDDPALNRATVNRETALQLQKRMQQSTSLIYAFSENSPNSKWMPWELGYFDGNKGLVAILPISSGIQGGFSGTEYLSIYPYIDIETLLGTQMEVLWVNESVSKYVQFDEWLINKRKPFVRNKN